ncbi:MAG: CBS domain-containing protein [Pseudomonadota bacterium]
MYVNEAMTTNLKTCRPHNSLNEIARMMWEGDCGAIPVVSDDNKPIGVITDRDIAMAAMLNHQPLWEIQASTVIHGQHLCCCNQQESIESCLHKMEQSEVRRVLITDQTGSLTGILSMGDALAFTRADNSGAAKRSDKVDVDNVLPMLQKVSAHHAIDNSMMDTSASMRSGQRAESQQSFRS